MEKVCVIREMCTGQVEVKKSRFIATAVPVYTEEEALGHIAAMKKQYWDARHNCHAFIIEGKPMLERCSDDGEPQGTAGKPMLNVLTGMHLVNLCVVVTRYFGGTLLGTGGLVRAYTDAVNAAWENGEVLERVQGTMLTIQSNYTDLGKLQYLIAKAGAVTRQTDYTDSVNVNIVLPASDAPALKAAVTEGTAGRAVFACEEAVSYVNSAKGIELL